LSLLARKSNQNACDLLKGDFFFREAETAKEKPSSAQAFFLTAHMPWPEPALRLSLQKITNNIPAKN